jgi:hypothetical protein
MNYSRDPGQTLCLKITLAELYTMQNGHCAIYASPTHDGCLTLPYLAGRPFWPTDIRIATVADFLDTEGWDCLEDDEPTDSTQEFLSLTIPDNADMAKARHGELEP